MLKSKENVQKQFVQQKCKAQKNQMWLRPDMYGFPEVRQHQSWQRSSCKITAPAEKCVIEFASGFCNTVQLQQEEQQKETPEHTKSAAACLTDSR